MNILSSIGYYVSNYFYHTSTKETMTNTQDNVEYFIQHKNKYKKCWAKEIENGLLIWKNKIEYFRILPKDNLYEIELKHNDYSSTIIQTDKIYKKGATFIIHMDDNKRIEVFSNYRKL